jgi:hypothetical protein
MGARARAGGKAFRAGAIFFLPLHSLFPAKDLHRPSFGSSMMSNASFTSRPLGTAMVGGAIAMATLDMLIQKNILTVDDVQAVLKTAQSSLVNSPRVYGSLDGARIIGEIKDIFARRERGSWSERRG